MSNPRTGCQSVIVFVTDGKDTDGENIRCGPGKLPVEVPYFPKYLDSRPEQIVQTQIRCWKETISKLSVLPKRLTR